MCFVVQVGTVRVSGWSSAYGQQPRLTLGAAPPANAGGTDTHQRQPDWGSIRDLYDTSHLLSDEIVVESLSEEVVEKLLLIFAGLGTAL